MSREKEFEINQRRNTINDSNYMTREAIAGPTISANNQLMKIFNLGDDYNVHLDKD